MKKIIESIFGLAGIFVLVNLATLFIPNFLGRLIVLIGVFVAQVIFEIYYDGFEWKDTDIRSNENVKRNSAFNFSKWLTMINFIYCGVAFNSEINNYGIALAISFAAIISVLMLLYYIWQSARQEPEYNGLLIIPIVISIIFSIYLNFGTQFIWMPISLFFIAALFGVFDELLYVIFKKWNDYLFNKIILATIAVLVLIGVISSIIEFWFAIISFFIIQLFHVSLWIWFLITIGLVVLFFVNDYLIKQSTKKRIGLALKEKIEAEKQVEIEKAAELRKKKEERIERLSRIPIGHPMETFDADLVFIAKLYNSGELYQNFYFSKILKIPLKNLVSVSHEKRQIIYDQNIVEALKMYNSLYKESFTDWFLESMTANFLSFCNFVEKYANYKGANYLKEEVKQICQGMVTCYPEFFK